MDHPAKSLLWTKVDERMYVATASVVIDRRPIRVELRIDGRAADHFRVDCAKGIPLWEAIDGSQEFPTTLAAAKVVAKVWFKSANDQGTLSPRCA